MGGEEFAVLTSGSVDAAALAEKVRNALRIEFPQHPQVVAFTVSMGVAAFQTGDERVEDLIHRADIALYQAKANGRDRVVLDGEGI